MQTTQVICAPCRRQLLAAAQQRAQARRIPQWQTQVYIRAASTGTPRTEALPDNDFVPSIDGLNFDGPPGARRSHDGTKKIRSSRPHAHRLPKRMPPNLPFKKAMAPSDKKESMDIFKKVVEEQGGQEEAASAAPKDISPVTVEFLNDLCRLRPMMREESMEACLDFFLANIWPKVISAGRPRLVKQRGTYLLTKVAAAKLADMDNERLPSVARITQLFYEMDSLSPAKWTDLIMGLIKNIVARSPARQDYPSVEAHEMAMARKAELLDDLVESWIIFHRYRLPANESELQTSAEVQFRLPDINEIRLRSYARTGNLIGAMGMLFHNFATQHREVPAVALATFVLLMDPEHSTVRARRRAEPLLKPIGHILSVVELRRPAMYSMLEPHPSVMLYVVQRWDGIIAQLREPQRPKPVPPVNVETPRNAGPQSRTVQAQSSIPGFQSRIMNALALSDVTAVEAAWTDYWNQYGHVGKGSITEMHEGLLDTFIMVFTALRRPQRAVDVWNSMERVGVVPTLKTWTCMIEGCRRAKNPNGLENVWRRLIASGLKLDSMVWKARIVGLMDCRQPEAGLRALSDMLRQSTQPGGVPLQIDSVNAAVAGLIRLNAMSAAKKVLTWASDNGVEPDVITYNTLLGPLVRNGDAVQIDALLKMMYEQKVQPDSATWTILLDGIISNIKNTSPDEQRRSVEKLLQTMDVEGVKANMETFARIMHLVIRDGHQSHHHTEGAIGAIYNHIRSKGLQPSPHIYTILLDHYFSRTPPALDEVNQLLAECGFDSHHCVLLDRGRRLDKVFWERVIRGYALAGDLDRAFGLFEQVSSLSGSAITLEALEDLLRCLVRENMMTEARRVVDHVRLHRMNAHAHAVPTTPVAVEMFGAGLPNGSERSRHRYWRHGFWAFALDCGLLSRAEWEQLKVRGPGMHGHTPQKVESDL
ncbi:hypothetical protein M406DRAFT_349256 [Cryphonectria parasitica EP155]|uniref:Pentacotripeptide-repeat region of PRORP domain-containing protein n=1 Tax=Cryphonectria parasitica (strain ATCC 38755 / EP155) TaxID=660469 RepID=A0A9P4YCF6_CRYP1|nr:uncharacterized protein M406DRAFT_349256 [Cryphonectria parasitica EP155]KAF3770501.1 hypothetical protein M406DRAFT_349256 [Cryphonectria parasitica EP155]